MRSDRVQDLMLIQLEEAVQSLASQSSVFGSTDPRTGAYCTTEGLVCRNADAYPVSKFKQNVFKYVRKGHVQTDEHWTKSWKRTKLIWERGTD